MVSEEWTAIEILDNLQDVEICEPNSKFFYDTVLIFSFGQYSSK